MLWQLVLFMCAILIPVRVQRLINISSKKLNDILECINEKKCVIFLYCTPGCANEIYPLSLFFDLRCQSGILLCDQLLQFMAMSYNNMYYTLGWVQ